jgi:hypothetical protein
VLSYRVTLDVPVQLVLFVSRLLAERRREVGTRRGTRALTCWKQAVFVLAWFRDRPDIRRLGQGFGISQATAYRYLDEAVQVLAARAPSLREALDKTRDLRLPYLILDGMIVAPDRCAGKKTGKKGKEIDRWYSGKARHPGGNIQALSAPGGVPLWVSGVLPGSTHDLAAAREQVLPQMRPYLKDLPLLADTGYYRRFSRPVVDPWQRLRRIERRMVPVSAPGSPPTGPVVVIGVGNDFRHDDGAGRPAGGPGGPGGELARLRLR